MADRDFRTNSDSTSHLLRGDEFSTRRGMTTRTGAGFTIVELLVVIIVIALLASLVITAYNGITKQATEASLQTDLRNARVAIENERALNGGTLPADFRTLGPRGVQASSVGQLFYLHSGSHYCVAAINPSSGTISRVSDQAPSMTAGICPTTVSNLLAGWWATEYLAADQDGNIYISGQQNRIRKITQSGILTTVAGTGTAGSLDGDASAAQFNFPAGIAIASDGTLFVADRNNHCIRRISAAGQVSTYAGLCGSPGMVYGVGTAARFNAPGGITIDDDGTLYVADAGNQRIRMIAPDQLVSTYAGTTGGYADGDALTEARFSGLRDVVLDSDGTLYVSDSGNHRIRKVSTGGVVSTVAGSIAGFADGSGSAALFNAPQSIAIDTSGNLYVADMVNNRIRIVNHQGYVHTLAGTGAMGTVNGDGTSARFTYPRGVSIDRNGVVYMIGWDSAGVRRISL